MRYIDPDGRFTFDPDNGIINANLNDYEDMSLASTQFVLNEGRGYNKVVATDAETGNTITFNNAESMVNFVSNMTEGMDFESMFSMLADASTAISIAAELVDNPATKRLLGPVSALLNAPQTLDDFNEAKRDPNLSTVSDVVIDIVGFVGYPGALISLTYSKTKPVMVNTAIGLTRTNRALEAYFFEEFGEYIKDAMR